MSNFLQKQIENANKRLTKKEMYECQLPVTTCSLKMNVSATTCLVNVFKDKLWLSVASSVSYGLGILVAASWICDIWNDYTSSHKVWTIFSILKAWKNILVSKNLN